MHPARPIVQIRAGSHLYGTDTPASDLDTKSVFLPSGRDILLQRVQASTVHAGDTQDAETHSLQRFLDLVAGGQPFAVELLFAPDHAMLMPPDPLWPEVQAVAARLLNRGMDVFVRYARRQALTYGRKGARAAAARQTLARLAAHEAALGPQARLAVIADDLDRLAATLPEVTVQDVVVREGQTVRHLDVCGRKAPFTATIRSAREMTEHLVAAFGVRAREAERQSGIDWKALSHAVRIGREAIELLGTGRLRFPLAEARRLLAIKQGRVPYETVVDEIEALLGEVEAAAAASHLPAVPDLAAAEALVLRAYAAQVRGA